MSCYKMDIPSLVVMSFLMACTSVARSDDNVTSKAVVKTNVQPAQVISATLDKTGQHPGTAPVKGPATVTCTKAVSDIPRPQPIPSCSIVAPGYSGQLNKGQSAGTSGAGTVTLNCNGQGNVLSCSATVQ